MGKAIIKVEHLKKYFKDVKAVDDVSFEVRDGELFSFLGLNGAGKSTTIDIISGVREKDSGEVVVDGVNIDYDLDAVKSKLGVVFQGSALDKELSAGDNLRYRAALYGLTGKRYSETLDDLTKRLDLKGLLRRPLGKLSGGQRRRIDIARALLHRPKILILDEPTTGLDPQTRIMVWNCLNDLRKETGLTIFFDDSLHGGGRRIRLRGDSGRRKSRRLRYARRIEKRLCVRFHQSVRKERNSFLHD